VAFASVTIGEPTQLEGVAVGGEKLDSEQGRKVILSLGKKVLSSGSLISTAVNFFTFGLGGSRHLAAGGAQRGLLDGKVLIGRVYPRLPDNGHIQASRLI
jgi:hypothetical protein